jgi:tripartite-type tricarboxylate transporter receptor subunit TctC
MKRLLTAALAVAALGACGNTMAQAYPSKPIRFVVPFTAGSGTDIIARTIADTMAKSMGQTIVVDNRPGAGGTIAAAQVARRPNPMATRY